MDFTIRNHGTVFVVEPQNDEAYEWLRSHVGAESWQWMGRSLAVDHRYALSLAQQLQDDDYQLEVV